MQLHALGVIPTPDSLSFYSDANYLFTEVSPWSSLEQGDAY